MPDHPDHEELAAWQAGALDEPERGRTAAHVAGCPDCGAVVGAVEEARQRLAVLDEPELPAGFHDRLAAAVESERGHRAPRRRPAWYQRPATWSAAAALLLFVAGAFGIARLGTGGGAGGGGGAAGSAAAQPESATTGRSGVAEPSTARAAALPVIRLTGEFSPARLQAAVGNDDNAKRALQQARSSADMASGGKDNGPGTRMSQPPSGTTMAPSFSGESPAPAADRACIDQAAPAGAVTPAFVATSTSNGQQIRILVAYVGDPPHQVVRYWAFPAAGCSGAPLFTGVLDAG